MPTHDQDHENTKFNENTCKKKSRVLRLLKEKLYSKDGRTYFYKAMNLSQKQI